MNDARSAEVEAGDVDALVDSIAHIIDGEAFGEQAWSWSPGHDHCPVNYWNNRRVKASRKAREIADLLARERAAERERIAEAIHAAKPRHLTRDYTPVDAAYDDAARIARTTPEEER